MKMIAILTATTLLAAGAAFAATTVPVTATSATAAAPAKPDNHCRNEANEKKLAGAARASFVKKCRADAKAAK